jgi:hypothetical protein
MDATTLQPPVIPSPADLGMDAPPVSFTAKAVEMVKDAIQREGLEGHGIRIGVMGGGCAGFQYSMDFEKEPKDGDLAFELDVPPGRHRRLRRRAPGRWVQVQQPQRPHDLRLRLVVLLLSRAVRAPPRRRSR